MSRESKKYANPVRRAKFPEGEKVAVLPAVVYGLTAAGAAALAAAGKTVYDDVQEVRKRHGKKKKISK